MIQRALFNMGFVLVLAGFVLAFIAFILLAFKAAKGRGRIRGGGAVMIGPFPFIFGTDKESVKALLILSIALIALLLVVMVFSAKIFG